MLVTVYLPPPASARVNSTDWPAFTQPRSTSGATGKSIVMAGQLMAGIGPWLRFTICLAGSTFFTVPVPTAPLPAGVVMDIEPWSMPPCGLPGPGMSICARAGPVRSATTAAAMTVLDAFIILSFTLRDARNPAGGLRPQRQRPGSAGETVARPGRQPGLQ